MQGKFKARHSTHAYTLTRVHCSCNAMNITVSVALDAVTMTTGGTYPPHSCGPRIDEVADDDHGHSLIGPSCLRDVRSEQDIACCV